MAKLARTQRGAKSGGQFDRRPARAVPPPAPQEEPQAAPEPEPDVEEVHEDESPRRGRRPR